MIITKYQNQLVKDTPHKIDVREMYNKESAQAMLMDLKPGESLKPHKTPVDVFFFIVEGTPTIHIGNESEICEAYTLVESPAGIVHFISNSSNSPARILVVKAPRPTSQSKVL
ncbi:MAG: cupin domain-containing protein [Bacteroidales bacterium]|nr:cupin domain-containing protein [Bacteroidales bacterium]